MQGIRTDSSFTTRANATDFITLQVSYLQDIVGDLFRRRQEAAQTNDPKLLSGGLWYARDYYDALNQLRKEATDETVQKRADDRLKWLITKGCFYTGLAPQDAFNQIPKSVYAFQIKKGVTPSEALEKIKNGFSILDCGIGCDFAAYRALRDVLTPQKFDHLFAADSPYPLRLFHHDLQSPLRRLYPAVLIESEENVQKGDILHFSNISEYNPKHPVDHSRGVNVTCSDGILKTYLLLGHSPEGVQKEEAERGLCNEFNITPMDAEAIPENIWKDLYSNYLLQDEARSRAYVESLREKIISWEDFQNTPSRYAVNGVPSQGKLALEVFRPNIQRIKKLAKTPLRNIRKVFAYMK